MCTEPNYALRLKTKYDVKFQKFGVRSSLQILCAVRNIGKDTSKLNYNREKYDLLMVSCGQCMQCRLQRVKQRSVMCMCESLEHENNSFVTLTFGYPQTYSYYRHKVGLSHYLSKKKAHFHEWSLETEMFQKFMKRLRFWYYNQQLSKHLISIGRPDLVYKKANRTINYSVLVPKSHIRIPKEERPFLLKDFKPKKIRCMHCGEYGDRKGRPHHHVILFGFDFPDKKVIYEGGKKYYVSELLNSLWTFGISRIGDCTYNSCAYVSRYVTKKINGNNQESYYNGKKPEYVTYSTKPVLGTNYFIKNFKEIVNTQELSVYIDKIYHCRMPKSYDNILKKIDIDMYNEMKEKRVSNSVCDLDKLLSSDRSIYAKLDSNHKICMSVLNKLVRCYEKGAEITDDFLKKAKAFGVSTKFFDGVFAENGRRYLLGKDYKSHKKRSSNEEIRKKYYEFELARKRSISNCHNVIYSADFSDSMKEFYKNMPNPYRCFKRGKMLNDDESIDRDEYIDEKGRSYVF